MLQSFIGTYDQAGLRSLRDEDEFTVASHLDVSGPVSFWAILDSDELPGIQHALTLGHRVTALQLLITTAKSLGPLG